MDVTERGERVTPDERGWGFYAHLSIYRFAGRFAQGKRVFDIGCGTGYGADHLLRVGASSVFGVDISELAISFCQKRYTDGRLAFAVMNAEDLDPSAAGAFGVVFTSNTLEHLAEVDTLLAQLASALPPDGVAIIAVPPIVEQGMAEENLLNPYHVNNLPVAAWIRKVQRFFGDVEGYRHWVTDRWVDPAGWPIDMAAPPEQTRIRETDFTFTRMPAEKYSALTSNITCVLVARNPRGVPQADSGPSGRQEWTFSDEATIGRLRDGYAATIGMFVKSWEGQLVRQIGRDGRVEAIFIVENGRKRAIRSLDQITALGRHLPGGAKAINWAAGNMIPVGPPIEI